VNRAATGEQTVRVLGRYVQFNSVFAGGVANLAAALANHSDTFRDRSESSSLLADRSHEVGSAVFYAAIDEFGKPSPGRRNTHRSLAQRLLAEMGSFYGLSGPQLDAAVGLGPSHQQSLDAVRRGYLVGIPKRNGSPTDQELLFAIGFHIGSETLADEEFGTLAQALQACPDLVDPLRAAGVYPWIEIHTTVEAEHATAGLEAANRALDWYEGHGGDALWAKQQILDGFSSFAGVQEDFLRRLLPAKEAKHMTRPSGAEPPKSVSS
jgi:hypothetical protein